jgi:hypothetical protein
MFPSDEYFLLGEQLAPVWGGGRGGEGARRQLIFIFASTYELFLKIRNYLQPLSLSPGQ